MCHRYLPLWLIAFLALLPSVAHAQFESATVLGHVTDQSGAAVPGATVTLTNLSTRIQAMTVSDDTGAYHRPNVIGDVCAAEPTALAYFTPASVVIPTDSTQPFGNAPRQVQLGFKVNF